MADTNDTVESIDNLIAALEQYPAADHANLTLDRPLLDLKPNQMTAAEIEEFCGAHNIDCQPVFQISQGDSSDPQGTVSFGFTQQFRLSGTIGDILELVRRLDAKQIADPASPAAPTGAGIAL